MKLSLKMLLQIVILSQVILFNFTNAVSIKKRQAVDINSSPDTCQTPGCLKAAAELRENMDEKVEPCNDFYKFACGGYIKKRTIPEDKSRLDVFTDIKDDLNNQLRGLLERQLDGSEPRYIKMIKDMYDSCMNTDGIEAAGGEPLKKLLSSMGGWPVVEGDSWDSSKFDWMETLFKFRNLGINLNFLSTIYVILDLKNNTEHIIAIDQTDLGVPNRPYLIRGLSDPTTQAYYNLMKKAAKKLGADEQVVEKELADAFALETKLAEISIPIEERRDFDSFYNKYTVKQLQEFAPQIDWLKYFNGLLMDPILETDSLLVIAPKFIKKFAEYIVSVDKRTIANYMMWRVVQESLPLLAKEWRDVANEYAQVTKGTTEEGSRLEHCIESVSDEMMIALNAYYVRNYFEPEDKEKAAEMVKYLQSEFLNLLQNIDWMDDSTKQKAIEKANLMASYVGYIPELRNDSLILDYYHTLTITPDNYFNNVLSMKKWYTDNSFADLRKLNLKGQWKSHSDAAVVNAFYNRFENSIEIPAGILQKNFFNKDRPQYMNFGAIGFVIGHEITHGFDDRGRQFDKDGNTKNWWDNSTLTKFKERTQCLIDQYNGYEAENGMNVNGFKTQSENIADNGGLKESFMAYHSWVKDNGPEPKLADLKYTPGQLFFISAANIYCSKFKPEALKLYITTNGHSPFPFRVKGPMSNFPSFAKEFDCPVGSPMNPEHKCGVW